MVLVTEADPAEGGDVSGDRCGTAALLGTGATATGWDVDRAVDASVDGAGAVPYPVAHRYPLPLS